MVTGLDALHRRFDAIPQKIIAAVADQLEKEAVKVVADMKAIVPVRTGALRDSIGWTWGDAPKGSISIGKVQNREYEQIAITIYAGTRDKSLGSADAFYAHFVEFGTSREKDGARPFFFPAWRANKRRVRGNIKRAVSKAIKTA
jgi:HK97 gp10 family phage protein